MTAVLHVISDRKRHTLPVETALLLAADAGADVIQIRDKRAAARDTYELCQQVVKANAKTAVFVNDRTDIAMAAQLPGIHLGGASLPVAVVREVVARSAWQGVIGVSVHSVEEAIEAQRANADYVTFGHVFGSESHRGLAPKGVRALARVVDALDIPVVAIGGIDATNVDLVLETGCAGVAVIGAVLQSDDPARATDILKSRMARSSAKPKCNFPLKDASEGSKVSAEV